MMTTDRHSKTNRINNLNELVTFVQSADFDRLNFHWLASEIPPKCTEQPCIAGVDEAGRGPVLGPMVYCVFYCPINCVELLKEIGCADSKTLTEKKREDIFQMIADNKDKVGWIVDVISPNKISSDMQKRKKSSLNEIAQNSTVSLINFILEKKITLREMFVDTIGPPDKYQEKLSQLFPNINIVVEKKADHSYPIVGAASICAKVVRDTVIQNWKCSESYFFNEDIGTGYPGDPKSKKFLLENKDDIFGFTNVVRFSWSTAAKQLDKLVCVEWEQETEDNNEKGAKISAYFINAFPGKFTHKTKFSFFKERLLNSMEDF